MRARRVITVLKPQFDVYAITRDDHYKSNHMLDQEHVFLIRPKNTRVWIIKIMPYILFNKFDLIICESDFYAFASYWFLSKILKYKIIFEAHGILSKEYADAGGGHFKFIFYKFIEKFCISRSDYVIALSEEIRNAYLKYNNNISLVPVFIDKVDICHLSQPTIDAKYIGVIGPFSLIRNKFTLDFISRNIDKFDERINFALIGKCDNRVFHPRLSYLGYISSAKEYLGEVAKLDAVLVLEMIPTSGPLNKILEPMSLGVPVFTTPKGAMGLSNLKNGENIFILEESDIINTINKILFDTGLMERTGISAKEYVNEYYNIDVNSRKLIAIINQLYI